MKEFKIPPNQSKGLVSTIFLILSLIGICYAVVTHILNKQAGKQVYAGTKPVGIISGIVFGFILFLMESFGS